ncbi:serine protease inhibitor, Kazal-type family protein [Musa troglodytarum]|uniref:Serine protease inhibitor, Kazal-type family protein n=1 Tax=Musa troglodytarum TaxID=320322 RepID=A0A9E7G179_9LILI|nr:serine protease inhibitor, Kazal-type family protein [Musa troglodytarum]
MATPRRLSSVSPVVLLALSLLCLLVAAASSEDFDAAADAVDLCGGRSDGGAPSCRINCFRPDPVCGVNGVTYWCGCPEAACASVRVAKRGPCQVGNGGSGLVSGQAFLLLHIVWLIVLGFAVLCGFL